jgi:hypothetical protein
MEIHTVEIHVVDFHKKILLDHEVKAQFKLTSTPPSPEMALRPT